MLKPLPTKNERKARIAAEVKLIDVLPNLYLPSSPSWQVRMKEMDPSHTHVELCLRG